MKPKTVKEVVAEFRQVNAIAGNKPVLKCVAKSVDTMLIAFARELLEAATLEMVRNTGFPEHFDKSLKEGWVQAQQNCMRKLHEIIESL